MGRNDDSSREGRDPAEGRPDLGIPGADRDDQPEAPSPGGEDELPERLGERISDRDGAVSTGEPDIRPDVEVPDESM